MTEIKHVLSAEQACQIVLGLSDGFMRDGKPERFVIQPCELSANGDYWTHRSLCLGLCRQPVLKCGSDGLRLQPHPRP